MDESTFVNKIRNFVIQRKLLTQALPSLKALNVALIHKIGMTNHMEIAKSFNSNGSYVHRTFNHFND